jgi:hypothetical protein
MKFRIQLRLSLKSIPWWLQRWEVVHVTVTSNGMTGSEWIDHFGMKGMTLSTYHKEVLLSDSFVPTNGVTTQVGILLGGSFKESRRTTERINELAYWRGLKPIENHEVACLLRDMLSDESMAKLESDRIMVMTKKPLVDLNKIPRLLGAANTKKCAHCMAACSHTVGYIWDRNTGFAYEKRDQLSAFLEFIGGPILNNPPLYRPY